MHPLTVLVVDDDPDILTILKGNLEMDGYLTLTASLGKNALEISQKEHVDIVILDLMLPDMDGIQVCRAIRKISAVPIIMLTAKDGVAHKVLGLESGADDYLVKPYDYLELAARINACLRRTQTPVQNESEIKVGSLKIIPQSRQVKINGRDVVLTRKEFDILRLLCENSGKVLDRKTIRKAIWPEKKLYRWSRAIDVHIQHLRAKVETEPEAPSYIITIPGVGYMLKDAKGACTLSD